MNIQSVQRSIYEGLSVQYDKKTFAVLLCHCEPCIVEDLPNLSILRCVVLLWVLPIPQTSLAVGLD